MASTAALVVLAVMVLFGLATAGVLAFALRDMLSQLAGDGDPGDALRVAMAGPVVYLVGFLVVLASVLGDVDSVGGVHPVDLGVGIIVLAAVPMAAGFYVVWQQDR